MRVIRNILQIVTAFIALALLLALYALKIEPNISIIKKQVVGEASGETIKIIQISDVQIGEDYTPNKFIKVVEKIKAQKPDILLFTGDLYENYAMYGEETRVVQALASIEAQYGKYAVWGNRDYGGGAVRRYKDIMEECGITLLENEGKEIITKDKKIIYLAGLDDYLLGMQKIEGAAAKIKEDQDYRILMTHEPDVADQYCEYGFDLIVAGHSHGGQVYIPFTEGITTSMARKYVKGFYELSNGTKLYVNPGIGTSRFPVRFLVPPEITLFQLTI